MVELKNYISQTEEQGDIHISEDVLAAISSAAAQEVEGVAGLSATLGVDLAERLGKKTVSKGVRVVMNGDKISVTLSLLLTYGNKIQKVGQEVQDSVRNAIESMTGLDVSTVNITIAGIAFPPKEEG